MDRWCTQVMLHPLHAAHLDEGVRLIWIAGGQLQTSGKAARDAERHIQAAHAGLRVSEFQSYKVSELQIGMIVDAAGCCKRRQLILCHVRTSICWDLTT